MKSNQTSDFNGKSKARLQTLHAAREYKPYPKYKDSDIEWLGEIPKHWKVKPIKRVCRIKNGATPSSGNPNYWDGSIFWATPEDIGSSNSHTLATTRRRITQAGYDACGASIVPAGSLVLSTRAPIGHLAVAKMDLCTNQGCRSLVPMQDVNSMFMYYAISAANSFLNALGQGSTFKELSGEYLKTLCLGLPDISEQISIITFLNRETEKIDALIEKKERLIELLKERRAALITRTVTKGLNPDAPMKDSGVEWLGEIPEEWDVKPLKLLLDGNDSGVWSEAFGENETVILRSTEQTLDGEWNIQEPARRKLSPEELASAKLCLGDIVITKSSGSAQHIGKAAIVDGKVAEMGCAFSNFMQRIRICSGNEPSYYWYLFNCPVVREQLSYLASSTTGLKNLNGDMIGSVIVPTQPHETQKLIVKFLDLETSKIDALIEKTREAIDGLKEFRSTLISAAVTGKINVQDNAAQ